MATNPHADEDPANGWESVALELVAYRSNIGVGTVRAWGRSLPAGASILDLGCGSGVPVSAALIADGFSVWAIDASPTLVAAFRARFPHAQVACEPAEASRFFDRAFDAVVAVGLMFLLPATAQCDVIRRVGRALVPGGRFLFTAPVETGTWADAMTGRPSLSLGADAYKTSLAAAGLTTIAEYVDEGQNHYYDAVRVPR